MENKRVNFTDGEKEVFDTVLIENDGYKTADDYMYVKAGGNSAYPLSVMQLALTAWNLLRGEVVYVTTENIRQYRAWMYFFFQVTALITPVYENPAAQYAIVNGQPGIVLTGSRSITGYHFKLRIYSQRKEPNVQQDPQFTLLESDEATS